MMKLDEFVSQTIKQIIDGVVSAQEYTKDSDIKSIVNPTLYYPGTDPKLGRVRDSVHHDDEFPTWIEFDVAVTASEGEKAEGGLGLFVSVFAFGAKAQADARYSEVSRIKFSIPIVLPIQT